MRHCCYSMFMCTSKRLLSVTFLLLLATLASAIAAAEAAEILSTGDSVSDFVGRNIHDHEVMVFAKSYCPYCKSTKETFRRILSELNLDWNVDESSLNSNSNSESESDLSYKVIELDLLPGNDGHIIQQELYEITGQTTVPNVFVGGVHIGGNSDVQRLIQQDQLHDMVRSVSAMRRDL